MPKLIEKMDAIWDAIFVFKFEGAGGRGKGHGALVFTVFNRKSQSTPCARKGVADLKASPLLPAGCKAASLQGCKAVRCERFWGVSFQ